MRELLFHLQGTILFKNSTILMNKSWNMLNTKLHKCWMLAMVLLVMTGLTNAQQWNPNHKIGTVTGVDHFAPGQTPDQLVEIFPAAIPNTGLTYQWYASIYPTIGFSLISGATAASYTLPAVQFTQTRYLKRVTTSPSLGQLESNVVKLTMVSANWEDINYIREHDVNVTGVTTWQAVDQLAIGSKLQVTSYMDGLGRSSQKINKGIATPATMGGAWGDIVQFSKYDEYGRENKVFLSYTTLSQPGKFKTAAESEQQIYYTSKYNETSAFASTVFDNSPLNRVSTIKKPGTAWAASIGISDEHDLNGSTDNVRIFYISQVAGEAPVSPAAYSANTLFKTTTTSENGKKRIQYKNNRGQLILTKIQFDDNPSAAHDGWICTYNIYDAFGSLRCQIQPEGVKYLDANSWSFSGTNGQIVLEEQTFQYFYDVSGRLIWKKSPGSDPLYMIYDKRDRLVFTQDGNQRGLSTPQWTVTVYDELDRISLKTLFNSSQTVANLQNAINTATATSSVTIANPANTGGGISIVLNTSLNALTSTDLNNTAISTILAYQFYDNYSFNSVKTYNTGYTNLSAYSTSDPNVISITTSLRTLGRATGGKIRILGTNNFLSSTQYYNEKGDVIQRLEDNIKSGVDIATAQYHFDGRLLSTCNDHTTSGTGYTNYKILTKYLFDQLGRVSDIQKQFGSNSFKTISSLIYDDIGRLKNKRLDPVYTVGGNSGLETLNFSYNIHGQLTGINKDYALKTPGSYNKWEHFFGVYLGFDNRDNAFTNGNLLGDISGQLWNTLGDDAQRRYDYTYDNARRLVNASFTEKKITGGAWSSAEMDFTVSGNSSRITYDLNGNLLNMLQKGVIPGSAPQWLDKLSYEYELHSNKVSKVTDGMTNVGVNGLSSDFKDGANGTNPDYVYDDNGNLVIDLNKNAKDLGNVVGANGIKYNVLSKPEQIRIAGKGTIQIVYGADGRKLQRSFTSELGGPVITTSYASEFVYQESSAGGGVNLQYINFEEGRIRVVAPVNQVGSLDILAIDGNIDLPNSKRGAYDYFIMDHLQNVRMVLTEEVYTAQNTCTMENAGGRNTIEEPIFGQVGASNEVATTRITKPVGWVGNTSAFVSQLGTSSGHNIGPNVLQKVMAGDLVTATANYYYSTVPGGNNTSFVSAVTSNLLQAISGSAAATDLLKGNATAITSQLSSLPNFGTAVQPNGSNPGGSTPQAFLTVLFFDERFNFVESGGVSQDQVESTVGSAGKSLVPDPIKAPKNGYVFVYLSNQSNNAVYFDDFKVNVSAGNIIEENHYYAYGLKIAAISSRKFASSNEGHLKNNYQMQGAYNEMDEDIGWNDFALRNYDPQIGRWVQHDPYDLVFDSPYAGMSANPANLIDPTGGVPIPIGGMSQTAATAITLGEVIIRPVRIASTAVNISSKIMTITSITLKSVAVASNIINSKIETEPLGIWVPLRNDYFVFFLQRGGITGSGIRFNQKKGFALEQAYYSSLSIIKNRMATQPGGRIPDAIGLAFYSERPSGSFFSLHHPSLARFQEIKGTQKIRLSGQIKDEIDGAAGANVWGTSYTASQLGLAEFILVTFKENLNEELSFGLTNIRNYAKSKNVALFTSYPLINMLTNEIKFSMPTLENKPNTRGNGIYIPYETYFRFLFSKPTTLDFVRINNLMPFDTNETGWDW